ncbi:hypothetical protein P389DRAFT_153169 [Cystobasidium minutum MCA 4210]|uniref:uncharacterized protein n=1 Tax=Cystobasidium minutum MCA 4210 TaxID=1397322 RepID=UPI0034CF9CD9|eukprot:jgi/Rhomi1/153169/estExt_Genewise1.C_4_t30216
MDIDSLQDGHNAVSDMKAASSSSPSAPSSSFNALRELAIRLYHARQEGGNDLDDTILSSALQHFATARQMARKLAMENKHDREEVARKRSNMDAAYLAQQNRNYEIGYLYREIEKCNDYDSIYQDLPLEDEEEWLRQVQEAEETSEESIPSDPHDRMVARLKHEVAQRQRAQAELKALLASKTKVIKETEIRKSSLEQLEKQLDEFIASAKAIQDKFSKM